MSKAPDVPVKVILDRVARSWRRANAEVAELVPLVEQAIGSSFQGMPKLQDELSEAVLKFQEAARQPVVVIATTGTTSSGKSTVANVLIGAELLPKAVQEMSAGVVTIIHDDKVQRLRIEATKGAQWETGEWDDLEAEEVQERLRETMYKYRDALDGDVAVNRKDIEPPACFVSWPTEMGRRSAEFGIPEGARLKFLDLPGLKYVDDDVNGNVFREQARKALCLVAYNSLETDPRKQSALLNQIVDQVRALGGKPARMLFWLNRIDVFATDSNPQASEERFRRDITSQIHKLLNEKLPQYSEEIRDIVTIPFSSEPALFASIAQSGLESTQIKYIRQLDAFYNKMIPPEILKDMPRNAAEFTEAQRAQFLSAARKGSRLPEFEEKIARHISDNLPELILPDLVGLAWEPANKILQALDGAITSYSLEKKEEVEAAQEKLEKVNKGLRKAMVEQLDVIKPLRDLPKGNDMVKILREYIPNIEKKIGENKEGSLAPLLHGLDNAISIPFNRLMEYVNDEFAGTGVEDDYIEASGAKDVREAIGRLKNGPYAKVAGEGGELLDEEAERARDDLQLFTQALSTLATNLLSRESSVQAEQIRDAFEKMQTGLTNTLTTEAAGLLADSEGFQNLRNVFDHKVSLDRLRLPSLRFESRPERLNRTTIRYKTETEQVRSKESRWYTLWLVDHDVVKTRTKTVPVEKTERGFIFSSLKTHSSLSSNRRRRLLQNMLSVNGCVMGSRTSVPNLEPLLRAESPNIADY